MSDTGNAVEIERYGRPAPVTRLIGWTILGALAAFLIGNILQVGFGFGSATATFRGDLSGALPLLIYVITIGAGIVYVLRSPDTALRWDAEKIHQANVYILRGVYFSVLFVGLLDVSISFMRVEKVFDLFLSVDMVHNFERPEFVGLFIYFPVMILSFVLAVFTRTLGFHWLALMIILAELSIVITRFVFSYEQAFMGDLVRYWYSALFLLAAAYTLHEEGHVRVDILYSGFSARKKGIFNVFGILLLGVPTTAAILAVGFSGKQSIINSPVMNFEVTQTGGIGMYVKYQMAAFLGIFAATMMVQFVSMLFDSMADFRGEPGHRETEAVAQ